MNGSTDWKIDFKKSDVEPADILAGGASIPASEASGCNWFAEAWIHPAIYLDWAKRSLEAGEDDYAWSTALSYAKRTVCRIIDELVLGNHLRCYVGKNYPQKIEALCQIGISVPSIVHELIIDPRNQLEHDYAKPEATQARRAVQIAELFMGAMGDELGRKPIVALAWNIQGGYWAKVEQGRVCESVNVHGFTPEPMLFVDVFDDPAQVKIVHTRDGEILQAPLGDFTPEEGIALAKKLREHYLRPSGFTSTGTFFYSEVKRQTGI